jgi:Male sterility protein
MQVEVVEGDILQPGCGLSSADRRRLAGCSVVVHAAASVCFTAPVRESIQNNYHVRVWIAAKNLRCRLLLAMSRALACTGPCVRWGRHGWLASGLLHGGG